MRLFPPTSIDKNCLIQGFNLQGPRLWTVKSRVGVETEPLTCTLPYWVIGIGNIGFIGKPDISCGEIIVKPSPHMYNFFRAFCRIHIQ